MNKIITKKTLPPGGWIYTQPETKVTFDGMLGWSEQVAIIVAHRKQNDLPRATPVAAAEDLEKFTCERVPSCCGSRVDNPVKKKPASTPRSPAPPAATVAQKAESAEKIVTEWLGEGGKAVSSERSAERASVCVACPYNKPAGFFDLSRPAGAVIKMLLRLKGEKKLETPLDDKLGVCEICGCDLKTKVHTPIDHIVSGTESGIMSLFPEGICWIRSEQPKP